LHAARFEGLLTGGEGYFYTKAWYQIVIELSNKIGDSVGFGGSGKQGAVPVSQLTVQVPRQPWSVRILQAFGGAEGADNCGDVVLGGVYFGIEVAHFFSGDFAREVGQGWAELRELG
jgi:hypothetical protein